MRITHLHSTRSSRRGRRREEASAVIVVILLLAIVFIYIGGNLRTLHHLGRELSLIERQQVRRLQAISMNTAAPGQKPEARGQGPQTASESESK